MGSSNDGSTAAQRAQQEDETDDPGPDQGPRGFFGRLLSAFSQNQDASGAETVAGAAAELRGLNALRKMRVDDVAVPKADIVAVPLDIGKDDLVAVFREHGFSRVVVYKGTLDHPQGLVLLKDLALLHGFGANTRFSLKRLLRPILFAPPSMATGVLLQKMQKERVHMALIIDEYGGVDGLVTIEDLIETVIGEIEDEHDEDEGALWKEERPGVIVAQSAAPLEEIEAALGLALRSGDEDEEIDTLGGLVFQRSGHVPAKGEVITHENGVTFEILDADPRRIKRLRVRRPDPEPSAK
ncbi:MAG TPA: transporter associated domain-containing protein [Tabrizicola sp.]|nr:transporter associated domain-containing protein [Tabrizicola sp.]